MAAKKPRKTLTYRRTVKPGNCFYCQKESNPDYLDAGDLSQFISDRAKIIGKDYTGLCAKHQRRLSVAVKRARHLSLLPFRPQL